MWFNSFVEYTLDQPNYIRYSMWDIPIQILSDLSQIPSKQFQTICYFLISIRFKKMKTRLIESIYA